MNRAHVKRVRNELKEASVGSIAILTPESRHLAGLIHEKEHIGGAVYGVYPGGLAWLVATSRRILFMDHKPFYSTTDEMTYDVIVGVQATRAGLFDAVTLRTRVNNYQIRFVNPKAAAKFINFIETRRLEGGDYDHTADRYIPEEKQPLPPLPAEFKKISGEALDFMKHQDLAVLSTVDRTGNVHGAVVYYMIENNRYIYFLTKSGTGKGRNILTHGQVALTIHEPGTAETVQLQGIAEVETDQAEKDSVYAKIVKLRPYVDNVALPPVAKLHEGSYVIVKVTPSFVSYHDYSKVE
jgi:general stress protein 26